jgi:hypothetical protein
MFDKFSEEFSKTDVSLLILAWVGPLGFEVIYELATYGRLINNAGYYLTILGFCTFLVCFIILITCSSLGSAGGNGGGGGGFGDGGGDGGGGGGGGGGGHGCGGDGGHGCGGGG